MKYKRILLKLSGEGLANKEKSLSIDYKLVNKIAKQVKKLIFQGIQISIVIGGGNFWRGASAEKNGIPRNRADYIGMLATIMNGLAIQSGFEAEGIETRVLSSIKVDNKICEYYIKEKAQKYLESGKVIVFVGGTGRPYFTTDTASTLFASEINAEVILAGKNAIDGVYNADPNIDKNATRYESLNFDEALEKNLKVIDATAFAMARDNNIELLIFNAQEEESICKVLNEEIKYTRIHK